MRLEAVVGIVGIVVFWMVFVAAYLLFRSWSRANAGGISGS